MKTRTDVIAYYRNLILDSELDSSPLPDAESQGLEESEYQHAVSRELALAARAFCASHDLDFTAAAQAVLFILFEKYTNSAAALGGITAGSRLIPVFLSSEKQPGFPAYLAALQAQLDAAEGNAGVSFEELCAEFDLRSLPLVTTDQAFYNAFSLPAYQELEVKLCVFLCLKDGDFTVRVKCNGALYSAETMGRIFQSYDALLGSVAAGTEEIGAMEVLSDSLREELDGFNRNDFDYDDSLTVIDRIDQAVARHADRVAVIYKDQHITYRQLGELSDRIGQYVHSLGIGKEDVVSILLPRCAYFPVAAVGVSKSGAAYQPLDPSYPPERLSFMMEDAKARLLIADKALLSLAPDYQGPVLTLEEIDRLPACTETLPRPGKEDLFILLYTSGSTGVPKGVMLEHRNLAAFCTWYQDYYYLAPDSRVAAYASFGFDANMMDLYPALTCGAQVHIIAEDIRLELMALNRYFVDNRITHSFITTQVGRQYADAFPDSEYPKYLSVGGETLVPLAPPAYNFYNVYGPTECTIFTTAFPVHRLHRNVPIGKALYNMRLYVADRHGRRVPVGVPGELWVSGPQVSRGYLNRDEQTCRVFITNPFTDEMKYSRVYRTGDVVRFLPSGDIEFIGRRDSQVKIRGFRIELSEVEKIIREFPGIKDATVAAFDEAGGGKYIAAYVVSDKEVDLGALNAFIMETKPPYMVPAVTMQIDRIPLNQNQKVNRRALPAPQRKRVDLAGPENETQAKLCECLSQVVGHRDFGINTDLTSAGLTSIASIKFVVLLSREFGVSVSARDFVQYDTIKKLESYLSLTEPGGETEKRDKYPLTQTQLGIYVECMMHPEAVFYNLPGYFALEPDTDAEALCAAIQTVLNAHPTVKCAIRTQEDGETYMIPADDREVIIERAEGTEEAFKDFFVGFARPFDLANGPLYRLAVYKTPRHLYLTIDFHHIICDGTSIAVFAEELDRVLRGRQPDGERYTQFDLAVSEEKALAGEAYQRAKAYYDGVFSGVSKCTVPDRDVFGKEESCGFYRRFSERLSCQRVQAFCEKNRVTPNVFFLSVMGYVLGKYANTEEACFTTVYNGRGDGRTASMMGMLVKTLPVLCLLNEKTEISAYMGAVQDQLLSSMGHDIYSFAQISRAYHIQADVMFVYQGDDFVEFDLGGQKTVFREGVSDKAKADVSIDVFVENETYRFEFEYRSDKYSEAFIARLFDILTQAAGSFLTAGTLGGVQITSPEQAQLIESFNQTDFPVEMVSVNRLFERMAARYPERTAVIACGESLTYDQLNRLSNRLAHSLLAQYLRDGGELGPDTIVGLLMDRRKEVYIAEQGMLKAGCAFLPMVPEYPDERIDFCLTDADCAYVITTEAIKQEREALWAGKPYKALTVEELLACGREENPNLPISADSLAYCIYTSGSTGKPKGVMIEHRNLCNFVDANERNVEIASFIRGVDTVLALASISFDVSILEHFVPLCNGRTVCMANEEEIYNPLFLAELMKQNHVQAMAVTPSYFANIIEVPQIREALSGVRAYDFGAESFPAALYDKIREISGTALIINGYGPTECTVSCTSSTLDSRERITIGKPASNVKTYIVDRMGHILPVGISGELIICGEGVGRGYRNLPDKTKAAFFRFKGMRAYHSGDLARWTPEGDIDFLGRLDNQVKLRGLRVELDEIETVLNSFEGVKMSKVIVRNNGSEDYLAGYFTAAEPVDLTMLTEHMKSKLAEYMVPGALMQLEEMPLTVNRKIDKKRLPDIKMAAAEREYTAPSTPLEEDLCDQFAKILHLERVGTNDDFFEIGGTSLSATKIAMYAITKGYAVVYKDVFANPTPAMLARFITEHTQSAADPWHLTDYDYAAIEHLLVKNSLERIESIRQGSLGDILLTGATGFLGIHVLREFLLRGSGTAYCLVRRGKFASCEKRLKNMLMYYFDKTFEEEFGRRIRCVDGDITDREMLLGLADGCFTTVVNCAACVKHFVSDDLLDRVNVEGVKNIIELCRRSGKRLVHISTTSVAGEGNALTVPEDRLIHENELYFGQIIENDYIRTKFLAERAILEACAAGELDGRIIRVGNLMSRRSDGEFQINFVTNGFMRTLNAYRTLGMFPMGAMHTPAEFSPIDSTAAAIVTLAASESAFTVFHAYNSHKIYMSDVIWAMRQYGFAIDVAPDAVFDAALKAAAAEASKSDAVLGLIAYASGDENQRYELMADNRFTVEALYRLGYKWPITDDAYLENAIRALDTLGFFEEGAQP